MAKPLLSGTGLRMAALVGTCFLLGSTGWIAWLYRITPLTDPTRVDFYTMVVGYLSQALGICIYLLVRARTQAPYMSWLAMISIVAYVALMAPATLSESLIPILAFGWLMNIMCGFFQAYYFIYLTHCLPAEERGVSLGVGYAATTIATWMLSKPAQGALTAGYANLVVCACLAALSLLCVWATQDLAGAVAPAPQGNLSEADSSVSPKLVLLACGAVVMASMVKNAGFSFPTTDLSDAVNLELSRLFYGIGLLAAGFLADHSRKAMLMCCAASLTIPFIMLSLSGAGASSILLWELGYLLSGFFTIWRSLLFTDLADASGHLGLACCGHLFGRVGDVLGSLLYIGLNGMSLGLIVASSLLFVVAIGLLFLLRDVIDKLHPVAEGIASEPQVRMSEEEILSAFCHQYELSRRESDVLVRVLQKKTNVEIAEELFVSEATIKFHVHNILAKTSCANRKEVIGLYEQSRDDRGGLFAAPAQSQST